MGDLVQSFIDSDLGVATATTMHTLGALGFLAGAVGYLAWHRALRRGHDLGGLLRASAFATYLSIAVNLLGGFFRTYESDHPRLGQIAGSAWVQAIAVKHLFLFAAMGAAIVLFERTVPRLRRAAADGTLPQVSRTPHRVAASIVLGGIAVAALLGSVSQVLPLLPAAPSHEPVAHDETRIENFTGTLAGTPLMPAKGGGAFVVPQNATTLRFSIDAGTGPGTTGTTIALIGPDGGSQAMGTPSFVVLLHPAPGAWRFELESPAAAGTAWTAQAKITVQVVS
ncbi:MAG: hypothetical protein QOG31_515 [Thermoplasmata archaeon]|nr:hypothetical protein [Thermoplasmata archaeon]